jgi:tetratricopeptide (TPR) repeat protein
MNEQRLEAYLNLINGLLSCPDGEETAILNANSDLIDASLVQTMLQVAATLRERGELDNANILMNIAGQLLGAYSNLSATATSQAYFNFLIEVLQATDKSRGNQQAVYPLLAANLDKLDENFTAVLQNWAAATLPNVDDPDWAEYVARVIGEFSNLMGDFLLGNRAMNLEIAIAGYEIVATIFTREASPENWATLQNNLGTAYSDRILGEKADNLEKSLDCYHQALLVSTREAFPEQWAMTQTNLGDAYLKRILGEKADNLEQAINYYNQALQVYIRETFPEEWAMTQTNLGNAYINLSSIQGERTGASARALAIRCYKEALQIRTPSAFPQDYTETKYSLGLAYEKDNQLELACDTFKSAIDAVESLGSEVVSGDEAKQKLAEKLYQLYQGVVELCLQLDHPREAIAYVERSKAPNLVELLATRDLYPKGNIPETVLNELERLRQKIAAQ